MAILNKVIVDRGANRQYIGDLGNKVVINETYTAAAAQVGDIIYMAKAPGGLVLLDSRVTWAALGASSTIKVGYLRVNAAGTMTEDDDYFMVAASTASAGNARIVATAFPFRLTEDAYLAVTVGGAAATGRIQLVVDALYEGPIG